MARPRKENETVDEQVSTGVETTEASTTQDAAPETANPHARAAEANSGTELNYDPNMGVPTDLDTEDVDTSTREYLASIVNGFRYFFPIEKCRSFNEAIQLGSIFIKENLMDGQIFSMNPQRNTPFLFVPECGIALNPGNPTWIYRAKETSPVGVVKIIELVRSGNLVLGEYGITKVEPKMKKPSLDHGAILDLSYDQFRNRVVELLNTQIQISEFGEVYSPGVELKALLKLEANLKNRDNYKKLLNEALKRVGGMIQYAEEEEITKATEQRQEVLKKTWDARNASSGVNLGSIL